jgi:hypothetical protein
MTGKVARMTVHPAGRPELAEPYEVIHLGGEAAAIVPLAELRRLAAGRPDARSHEDVMAELLGSNQ